MTRQFTWLLAVLILWGAMSSGAFAQLKWDNKEFMDVNEIRPGMQGYGLTVFQGTKIEKFTFDVVAVLSRIDLDTDLVMVKITSGPVVAKHWGIVAGMSGSPMYINGRLIGALGYGWGFSLEPIGGVTPIREMLESYQPGATLTPPALTGALAPRNGPIKLGKRLFQSVQVAANPLEAKQYQQDAGPSTMVLTPVATPLVVSGMNPQQLSRYKKTMEPFNFKVIPGISGGYVDKKLLTGPVELVPGAAIGCGQLDGDMQTIATGTVTYRKGNVVLAYGHPFSSFGDIRFPMFTSYVYGVMGGLSDSWKMCVPIKRVGAVTRDGMNGIGGVIGMQPRMVPVDITLHNGATGYQRKFHIDVAELRPYTAQWILAGPLLRCAVDLGISGVSHVEKDWGVYDIRAAFDTDKYGLINQHTIASAKVGGSNFPFIEQYGLSDVLLNNPYEKITLKKLSVNVEYTPNADETGRIEQVTPDRLLARPGETVNLTVKIRRYGQQMETRQVQVTVPENTNASMMAVGVIGGAESGLSRQVMAAMPTRAEGAKGLIRMLSGDITGRRLVVAQFFPTPSFPMGGSQLSNLPAPLSDLLPLSDLGVSAPFSSAAGLEFGAVSNLVPNMSLSSPRLRPTIVTASRPDPLLISGGQLVTIAIDNGIDQPGGSIDYAMPGSAPRAQPLLTTSGQSRGTSMSVINYCEAALHYSPAERKQATEFFTALDLPLQGDADPFTAPALAMPGDHVVPLPLSCAPMRMVVKEEGGTDVLAPASTPGTTVEVTAQPEASPLKPEASSLLSTKQAALSLANARDFARGQHFGTAVTSHGRLTLAPGVRSLFQPKDVVPWKVAVSGTTVYVAGWGSNRVVALHGKEPQVVFPATASDGKNAKSVSALAVDGQRLLVATWPDHIVRLVAADGTVLSQWTLPAANIWDVAVTSDGKRFAACDKGAVYLLSDDAQTPIQVACSVPDLNIYTLATDTHGNLYLASSPRGLIYRYSSDEHLSAVYEATDKTMTAVTSLAVDKVGNVYAGLSPSCSVLRIAPSGAIQQIMTGAGKDNKHVLALQMVGDNLYAATSLAGGIYRIAAPASPEPDVMAIFAREDTGNADSAPVVGPESLAVTALAAGNGSLYAATAFPAQVLKIDPRGEGAYLSPVLRAPAAARWGTLDLLTKSGALSGLSVESRSGNTGIADNTWNAWSTVGTDDRQVSSAPAPYIQFRIRLTATAGKAPALEELRLPYQVANQAPKVKFTELKAGAAVSGKKELKWDSGDPDNDALVDTLFTSADNGKSWQPVLPSEPDKSALTTKKSESAAPEQGDAKPADKPAAAAPAEKKDADAPAGGKADVVSPAKKPSPEVIKKTLTWDTTTLPDGAYLLKVVSSDKYARPADPKSAEAVVNLIVDNTPPTVSVEDKVTGMEQVARLELVDALTPLTGASYRLDDGPWIALVPTDGLFSHQHETVRLLPPDGAFTLTPGEHKLTLQAKDAAGNMMERVIMVEIS